MKAIIFISFFTLIFLPAFAQKPDVGDKQIVLGIQGTNEGYLMIKSYYKNNMARRYAFGGSGNSYSNRPSNISGGYKTKNNSFYINSYLSYGIQKSFDGFDKIEPYIGIDYVLSFNFSHSYYKREVVDTSLTGVSSNYGDFNFSKYSGPFIVNLGLKPVAGFNYYIWENFAVGIEYSISLFYINYTFSGYNTEESQIGGVHQSHTFQNGSAFNIGTSFANKLAVTVNYRFGNKKNKKANDVNENSEK